jgi:hypothetical protein
MSALTLDDLRRDRAASQQLPRREDKWTMNAAGEWVRVEVVRNRDDKAGWEERRCGVGRQLRDAVAAALEV